MNWKFFFQILQNGNQAREFPQKRYGARNPIQSSPSSQTIKTKYKQNLCIVYKKAMWLKAAARVESESKSRCSNAAISLLLIRHQQPGTKQSDGLQFHRLCIHPPIFTTI